MDLMLSGERNTAMFAEGPAGTNAPVARAVKWARDWLKMAAGRRVPRKKRGEVNQLYHFGPCKPECSARPQSRTAMLSGPLAKPDQENNEKQLYERKCIEVDRKRVAGG